MKIRKSAWCFCAAIILLFCCACDGPQDHYPRYTHLEKYPWYQDKAEHGVSQTEHDMLSVAHLYHGPDALVSWDEGEGWYFKNKKGQHCQVFTPGYLDWYASKGHKIAEAKRIG
jgi:hypothetical protein